MKIMKQTLALGCLFITIFSSAILNTAEAQQNDHPFESEIKAYEQADAKQMPPENGILFVGSSSIRMWKSLEEHFPNKVVINRGFGGSTFTDLLHYMDRIVLPYKPQQIFVYEGDNDTFAGVRGSQIFDQFKIFTQRVHKTLPETEIIFISIKPSPSRSNIFNEMHRVNMLIKSYALLHPDVGYVDVFNPMLNASGGIRSDIFMEDNLHMNDKGYDLWQKVIRPYLD